MVVSRVFFAATASHRHFQNGFPGFPIHSVDSGPPEQRDLRRDVGQVWSRERAKVDVSKSRWLYGQITIQWVCGEPPNWGQISVFGPELLENRLSFPYWPAVMMGSTFRGAVSQWSKPHYPGPAQVLGLPSPQSSLIPHFSLTITNQIRCLKLNSQFLFKSEKCPWQCPVSSDWQLLLFCFLFQTDQRVEEEFRHSRRWTWLKCNLHYTLKMSNTSNQGNKLRSAFDSFYYITVKTIDFPQCYLTSGTGVLVVFQLCKKTLFRVLESILDLLSFISHHL